MGGAILALSQGRSISIPINRTLVSESWHLGFNPAICEIFWMPAFAGMTNLWMPAFAGMTNLWMPAFAGMTPMVFAEPELALILYLAQSLVHYPVLFP